MRLLKLLLFALATATLLYGLPDPTYAEEVIAAPPVVTAPVPVTESPGLPVDQWAILVGTFLPLLIAVVNRQGWSAAAKSLGALAIVIGAAAGEVYWRGDFSVGDWAATALTIFVLTATTYHGFWRPTGIAPAIERATG